MPKTEQLQQNESLAHTIRNRRSIRSFKPETVPSEVILDMLETAVYAPNHRLTEPWRFIYAASEAGKAKLADSYVSFFKKIKDDFNEEKERNMRKNLSAVPGFLLVVFKEDENEFTRNDDFAAKTFSFSHMKTASAWSGKAAVSCMTNRCTKTSALLTMSALPPSFKRAIRMNSLRRKNGRRQKACLPNCKKNPRLYTEAGISY